MSNELLAQWYVSQVRDIIAGYMTEDALRGKRDHILEWIDGRGCGRFAHTGAASSGYRSWSKDSPGHWAIGSVVWATEGNHEKAIEWASHAYARDAAMRAAGPVFVKTNDEDAAYAAAESAYAAARTQLAEWAAVVAE